MGLNDALLAAVYFGVGFGAGVLSLALWQHRHGQVALTRVLAVAILGVVSAGSLLSVWTASELREQAACQSRLNAGFLTALTQNTELNERERSNLDRTVERLVDGDEEGREVLRDYLAEREEIEEQRAEYPPLPSQVCE